VPDGRHWVSIFVDMLVQCLGIRVPPEAVGFRVDASRSTVGGEIANVKLPVVRQRGVRKVTPVPVMVERLVQKRDDN
jgi:hypothetical protein